MIKKSLFLTVFVITVLCSCKFKPNIQQPGEPFLQGIWQQDDNVNDGQLLTLEKRRFTFTCDSFYLLINTTSKVDLFGNSCFNKGKWQEYVKGTYVLQRDTLKLKGAYVSEKYRLKTSPCYRNGNYEENFILTKKEPSKAVFSKLPNAMVINFSLQKKLKCNPKVIR